MPRTLSVDFPIVDAPVTLDGAPIYVDRSFDRTVLADNMGGLNAVNRPLVETVATADTFASTEVSITQEQIEQLANIQSIRSMNNIYDGPIGNYSVQERQQPQGSYSVREGQTETSNYSVNTDSYNSNNSYFYWSQASDKIHFHASGTDLFSFTMDGNVKFEGGLTQTDAIKAFFEAVVSEFPQFAENLVKKMTPKSCHICGNTDCLHMVAVCQDCDAEIRGLD